MISEYGQTETGALPASPDPKLETVPITGGVPVIPVVDYDMAPVTGAVPVVSEGYLAPPVTGAIPVPVEAVLPAPTAVPEAAPIPAEPVAPPPLDQWQFAPYLRWSMQNIESFLPVHKIARGERTTGFGYRGTDLRTLAVAHPWDNRAASFAEVMAQTETDGWLVLHRGDLVGTDYSGELTRGSMHLLMSVSKSLTATTAGLLVESGELDLEAPVTEYVPELAGSGYEGALVRHPGDMRTGVLFSEEYLNDDAEVRLLEEAIGWAPKRHAQVPDTLLGFLATLRQAGPYGGPFDYTSAETNAPGFGVEGAPGRHPADVMSERLWQPMGAEFDAHVGVDSVGAGMFDGGVSAAMQDLARFGHLFVNGGCALDGARVLSESWVADTFSGGPDSRAAFAASPEPTLMPGGMYRNGFWFPGESGDVMLALGIHGQMIYMNRATGVVGVKVSSWATPQDAEKLFWTIRAFETASWALDHGAA